jgi:protein-tyrosine phosphatase
MKTSPYVIDWPAKGKLAMMPRPAGGLWLADDLKSLREKGADTIVSALTEDDRERLDLLAEPEEAQRAGLDYLSFPITDFGVPDEDLLWQLSESLASRVEQGRFVVVHCFGGVGRSGVIAGATLIRLGATAPMAVELMCRARGVACPETPAQHELLVTLALRAGRST